MIGPLGAPGAVKSEYGLGEYKAKFGAEYYNFHRIDMQPVFSQLQTLLPLKLREFHHVLPIGEDQNLAACHSWPNV